MSGILHEFQASNAKYSVSENAVFLVGPHIGSKVFSFDIFCRRKANKLQQPMSFFFNTKTLQCLVLHKNPAVVDMYKCYLLRFWLSEDLPVLSVTLFDNQDKLMEEIYGEFSEKYASIILDGIINS